MPEGFFLRVRNVAGATVDLSDFKFLSLESAAAMGHLMQTQDGHTVTIFDRSTKPATEYSIDSQGKGKPILPGELSRWLDASCAEPTRFSSSTERRSAPNVTVSVRTPNGSKKKQRMMNGDGKNRNRDEPGIGYGSSCSDTHFTEPHSWTPSY